MAYFLFIDESGQDHNESPYEVLAGVSISDEVLWGLIQEIHDAEITQFGRRYSAGTRELKGKKILKTKTFRLTGLNCGVLPHEVPVLARENLDDGGANCSVRHLRDCLKTGCGLSFGVIQAVDVDPSDAWPDGQDRAEDPALPERPHG